MAQRKIMEWTKNNVYCSEEKDLIQRNKIEYCASFDKTWKSSSQIWISNECQDALKIIFIENLNKSKVHLLFHQQNF